MDEQQKLTLTKVFQSAIKGALVDLHTATIAKVIEITGSTISCHPVVSRLVNGEKKDLPIFSKVPVINLQGGSSYTIYPVSAGDYCLLIFAERCLDNWKSGIDNELPPEYRMHDYSDGIAFVGLRTLEDGIEIPTGKTIHNGNVDLAGDLSITGNLTVSGTITAGGDITSTDGDVIAGLISLKNHTHPIAWTDPAGSGVSGVPQ